MEETTATETIVPTIAPEEDFEAKYAQLETEKENYRKAYLKEAQKKDAPADEEEEIRIRRIAQEELANSKLADIAREQDELIRKTLKENKELKLASLNKTSTPPAALGSHSESTPVRDTAITPEQMDYFKAKGWSEKEIAAYKKNLQKRV